MLHWPDSMMTYLQEKQILFSSHAFGAHLASGERFYYHLPQAPEDYAHQRRSTMPTSTPFGGPITQLFDKIAKLGLTFKIIARTMAD